MRLLKRNGRHLAPLEEKPFKLERDLQKLVEQNLNELLDLQLVKSEYVLKQYRFDTLAFDQERKSFVIIEYKRSANYSVVDQGISYLNMMLDNQAELLVDYNETFNCNNKRDSIDWSQTRVIFVAPSFTQNQKQAVNFKDLPIELCEVKQFEDGLIYIDLLRKTQGAPTLKSIRTTTATEDNTLTKITKEFKTYTEEEHLDNKPQEVKELYEDFKTAILNLSSDITVDAQKHYIAFKRKRNVVDIEIQKVGLKLWLNSIKGKLNDPKGITRDISTIGHLGNGDYEVKVKNTDDLEYIMSLVKQVVKNQ